MAVPAAGILRKIPAEKADTEGMVHKKISTFLIKRKFIEKKIYHHDTNGRKL